VARDCKSCSCKGLRRSRRIFAIKKTNPNEPKPPESKTFFYETNPNLLDSERLQTLFLQRFTKAESHFAYQENKPKRTQTQRMPAPTLVPDPRPLTTFFEKTNRWQPQSRPAGVADGSTPGYTDFVAVWGLANGGIWLEGSVFEHV
jgi:hypothetical protein